MNDSIQMVKKALFKRPSRRVKILWWTPELFLSWRINPLVIKASADGTPERIQAISVKGLPEDAEIEAMAFDVFSNRIGMRVHSDTFPEVPDCEPVPEIRWDEVLFSAHELDVRREVGEFGTPCLVVDVPGEM